MTAPAYVPLVVTASSPHALSNGELMDMRAAIQSQLPRGALVVVACRGVTLNAISLGAGRSLGSVEIVAELKRLRSEISANSEGFRACVSRAVAP
jgi:hypothetical protein